MRRAAAFAVAVGLLGGCALRPRYADFVAPTTQAKEVRLQVVDKDSGAPVPGARIELGDRARYRTTADEQGYFTLPVEGRFSEENALLVVNLPRGVSSYRLVPEPSHDAVPVVPVLPPEVDLSADAGITTL